MIALFYLGLFSVNVPHFVPLQQHSAVMRYSAIMYTNDYSPLFSAKVTLFYDDCMPRRYRRGKQSRVIVISQHCAAE